MVSRGPFVLEVPGRTFRFEIKDYGGPYVLGKGGRPLADQPGGRSPFWEAYWQWDRQGRRVDDHGRCIFKWETALVQITKRASRHAHPATPRGWPGLTARVTIRSVPDHAEIFSDGRFVGNAPAVLMLPVGKYQLRAVLNGHKEWVGGLELTADSDLTLVAELAKLVEQAGNKNDFLDAEATAASGQGASAEGRQEGQQE